MKIDLPLEWWGNEPAPVVRAELVPEIAPHLAALCTPAVHRSPQPIFGEWQVSDVETGQRIGRYYRTRTACLAAVADLLASKTIADIAKAHRNFSRRQP